MDVTSTDAYDDLWLVEQQIDVLLRLNLTPDISAAISITCNCVNEFREALSEEKTNILLQEEGAAYTSNKSTMFKAQARSIFTPPLGEQSPLSHEGEPSSAIKNSW